MLGAVIAAVLTAGVMIFAIAKVATEEPEAVRAARLKRDGVCGRCGYAVRGLTGGACPECGGVLAEVGVKLPGARDSWARIGPYVAWTMVMGALALNGWDVVEAFGPNVHRWSREAAFQLPDGELIAIAAVTHERRWGRSWTPPAGVDGVEVRSRGGVWTRESRTGRIEWFYGVQHGRGVAVAPTLRDWYTAMGLDASDGDVALQLASLEAAVHDAAAGRLHAVTSLHGAALMSPAAASVYHDPAWPRLPGALCALTGLAWVAGLIWLAHRAGRAPPGATA